MLHFRRTQQITPGRQADAVARAHQWVAIFKEAAGIDVRVSVVTTGTLGRMCVSADFESMGAREAIDAKGFGSPKGLALLAKQDQEERGGTFLFVPGSIHDEFWRDA
jgi:hypothetical protein